MTRPLPPSPLDWPAAARDAWEERAAIMEWDGCMTRELAERLAEQQVRDQVQAHREGRAWRPK